MTGEIILRIQNCYNDFDDFAHLHRSTDQFSVALSEDNVAYTMALTDSLPDARFKECGPDIPLIEFDINKAAQFANITIISHYHNGPALQYINFIFI